MSEIQILDVVFCELFIGFVVYTLSSTRKGQC